jgi:hypothetical protein
MSTYLPTAEQLDFVHEYCAKLLKRCMKGGFLGTGRDDALIIWIIASLTKNQTIGVDKFYRTMNDQNQSLPDKLKSFGGSYGNFLSALCQSSESFHGNEISLTIFSLFSLTSRFPHLLASLLKTALDGLVADTAIINEIFCLPSHGKLTLIIDSFARKYNINIRDCLQSKLGKNHVQLLTKLLQSGRVEDQTIDEALAVQQATSLNTILDKTTMLGGLTDEATLELIDLILTLSYSQAQVVKRQFEIQQPTRRSVETLITQRVGGGLQEALLLLLSVPLAVYARKIMEACTGGSEEAIWRIIGGHDVDYVSAIAEEYARNFNADMRTVGSLLSFLHPSLPSLPSPHRHRHHHWLASAHPRKSHWELPRSAGVLSRALPASSGLLRGKPSGNHHHYSIASSPFLSSHGRTTFSLWMLSL